MTEIVKDLVSTIIPVYNRSTMLREAVQSVLYQTYRPIEIIISDDGSTDETPLVCKELTEMHPGVVFCVRNENRGAGPARESGRRMARGEFIQYLDSDDLISARKFELQVAILRKNLDCGVAYGRTRLVTMGGEVLFDPYKWTGREMNMLFPALLVDRWWNTQTPLFRRAVCDAVGPWSDLRYSQDWEYDGRVGALGTKLAYCDETVCDTRVHSDKRQTGHGKWLDAKDRVKFLTLMFGYAVQAGVALDTPEMRHFSRWVFSNARQCGAMGDANAAETCFKLAVKAAVRKTGDFKVYHFLSKVLGWRLTGKFAALLDSVPGRSPGPETKKLSWMWK